MNVKTDKQAKSERKRRLTIWHVLALIPLVFITVFVVYRWSLHTELRGRIKSIQTAGYPVTLAELDRSYETPPQGQNAAERIGTTMARLKFPTPSQAKTLPLFGSVRLPPRTKPMDEELLARITQLVEGSRDGMELLAKGARLEHSRYPIDLTMGYETLTTHLNELRQTVNLLCPKDLRRWSQHLLKLSH